MSQTELWGKYSTWAFGISPNGNGLDCHRTWEMLYFGMIPIVKQSSLTDSLLASSILPVIVIQDWEEVCKLDLQTIHKKLSPLLPVSEKIFTIGFWLNNASSVSSEFRVKRKENAQKRKKGRSLFDFAALIDKDSKNKIAKASETATADYGYGNELLALSAGNFAWEMDPERVSACALTLSSMRVLPHTGESCYVRGKMGEKIPHT
jgi:hypothetical protein